MDEVNPTGYWTELLTCASTAASESSSTSGTSTSSSRFFLTHTTLSTHEDTAAWATNFRLVLEHTEGKVPMFRMADGDWGITNAGKEVFGEEGTRLMCWAHVFRNLKPKLDKNKQ